MSSPTEPTRKSYAGEAHAVVAHAQLRRRRGRKPSMAFRGVTNPREALRLAEQAIQSRRS